MISVIAVAVLAAGIVASGPSGASAPDISRPLPCAPDKEIISGNWQAFTAGGFPTVAGATGAGGITAAAVDPLNPTRVLITDGISVRLSDSSGCGFRTVLSLPGSPDPALPISGATATIISISFIGHRALLLVRDGSAALARPHIIQSASAESGTWTLADSGLPPSGAPGEIKVAGDGRTAYVSVTPATSPVAELRPIFGTGLPVLYRSSDAGLSWAPATAPSTLSTARPLRTFAVDPGNPSFVWGVIDGQIHQSTDGGATFVPAPSINTDEAGYDFTVLDAYGPKSLVAFSTNSGDSGPVVLVTHNAGVSFRQQLSPGEGVTSAATRGLHPASELVAVDTAAGRKLFEYFIDGGQMREVTPRFSTTVTGAQGDLSTSGATFHAHSATQVLRYLDSLERGQLTVDDPSFVNGLLAAPKPGKIVPSSATVRARVGAEISTRYTLRLPPNPSPLDVFLAIDTSKSMHEVIDNLQLGLLDLAAELARRGVNIAIGLGAIGTSPCQGSAPDPPTDPTSKGYIRPSPFKRLRAVGPLDQGLSDALSQLKLETQSSTNGCDRPEGQLVALDQIANGSGVRDPALFGSPVYVVAPGQVAGWRQGAAARRIIVVATDGSFGNAQGTPHNAAGGLDFVGVGARLREQRASVIGLSSGDPDATHDESLMATLTGGITPPAGINCHDADVPVLAPGTPVVCGTHEAISASLLSALAALSGSDAIKVKITDPGNVVRSVDHSALDSVNLFDATSNALGLTLGCSAGGSFPVTAAATLRGVAVGSTSLTLICSGPPKPQVVVPPPLIAPVAPQVAPAPAAPVPPAQPPGQLVNVQAQPAAAAQREDAVQVAVADQDSSEDSEPATSGIIADEDRPMQELAMSARSRDSADALYALGGLGLSSALGAAVAVGLRTRSRTRVAVTRAD